MMRGAPIAHPTPAASWRARGDSHRGHRFVRATSTVSIETRTVQSVTIRLLGPDGAAVLDRVASDVFDFAVDARWTAEFFADPRHHLVVALDGDTVVGIASGVHYVHPDKPPELFVNEVGVAPTHQGQGIGRQLMQALLARGRELGCREAWVLTDETNVAARRLYAAAGGVEAPKRLVMVSFRLAPEA